MPDDTFNGYSLLDTLWYARSTEYHCKVLLCLLVLVLITAYWIFSGNARSTEYHCTVLLPLLLMCADRDYCVQTETTVCRPRLLCADRDYCVQTETIFLVVDVCRPRLTLPIPSPVDR